MDRKIDIQAELRQGIFDKIARGIAAADAGKFADQNAMDRVRNKYRPANERVVE